MSALEPRLAKRFVVFGLFAVGLTIAFATPLSALCRYALHSDLYSHALLIPLISAYLAWLHRGKPLPEPSSSLFVALVPLAFGMGILGVGRLSGNSTGSLAVNDILAPTMLGYLCLLWSGAFLILGSKVVLHFAFPFGFLVFMVPMPGWMETGIEVLSQHASAAAAGLLFEMTGSSVLHDGLVFRLPGIVLQVAQECSGIRSTLVLFITSLLAGHLFLKSPWKRALLALVVIPLGILRNGFRIFTLGMLCTHVSPTMIDSPIHHRGGPLFFLISLIPFFVLLAWLRSLERRQASKPRTCPAPSSQPECGGMTEA
jgi:exosortase C (VPDSG-CTERM-specific)